MKNNTDKTPIKDGDTRPDRDSVSSSKSKNSSPVAGKKNSSTVAGKKKLTNERGADTNSLEDYRDAK